MKSFRNAVAAVTLGVLASAGTPAHGADGAPTVAGTTMDPALKRELNGIAATLLLAMGAAMAGGTLENFDPGPALERGIGRLASGPELDALLDRILGEAAKGGELSPEMRAALGVALRGMINMARREMARDAGAR